MKLTKLEKILSVIVLSLVTILLVLTYQIIDQDITLFGRGNAKYSKPPSMEKSIERASMIFICETEKYQKTLRCKITDILYKDPSYDFPFGLNEYFPDLEKRNYQDKYHDEGKVVILSSKKPIVQQTLSLINGYIPGFNGISIEDFKRKVEEEKKSS